MELVDSSHNYSHIYRRLAEYERIIVPSIRGDPWGDSSRDR